jgi:hypothetical protein
LKTRKAFIKFFIIALLGVPGVYLYGCGSEPLDPNLASPPNDGRNSTGDTEEPDAIKDLESIQKLLGATELVGLAEGAAVGNTHPWPNSAGDYNISAVGGEATYYSDPLGIGAPSVFICGKNYNASQCVGSGHSRGTQLRLAVNHAAWETHLGDDSVSESSTGGGSFSLVTVVSRVNSNETPIVYHRDGNAFQSLGVYLGWRNDTTLRFSTQGRNGANTVEAEVDGFSQPELTLIAGVFSRQSGLKLFVNGELVAQDSEALNGVDITNIVIPTLGYRQGGSSYGFHLFEWAEFNTALDENSLCLAFKELSQKYQTSWDSACP